MESRVLERGQGSIYMGFNVNVHGLNGTAGVERGQGPILHGIPCQFPVKRVPEQGQGLIYREFHVNHRIISAYAPRKLA